MGKYALSLLAQRFVLPIILAACFLFRPVGLSVPYFLLFLYLPHVPVATARSMKGSTGVYLKILIVVAVLLSITQICFQTTLQLLDQNILSQCENLEKIFRHVGLVRLDNLSPFSVVYWVLPEAVMLITSITLFILLRKFSMDRVADVENNTDAQILLDQQNEGNEAKQWTKEKLAVVSNIGVILGMFLIVCVSGFRPSVPGAVYYLIYLGLGTWWAIYKSFVKPFAIVSRIMMFFLCVHMAALLAYQNPWPQEFLDSNSTIARIMGLTEFFTSSCENDTRIVHFDVDYELDYYFNPLAILICYYTLSITSAFLLSPKALLSTLKNRVDSSSVPNERTPLMRSSTKRLKSDKSDRSPAAAPDGVTEIPMEDMETQGPGFMSQVSIGLTSIGNEIYKNSYVFTNITMMTWSIMYHSWMTFVLLIGANILWMIPNKRQAMLKTSPVIVVYAIILLLANYVYSLNLNDDELPTKVDTPGINLIQIGLIRYLSYPLKHILIKSLFTIMFWITFRQMVVENRAKRQRSTLADMVAPLQVTVGAATTDLAPKIEDKKSSALMTRLGAMFNTVLLKTWLWIVILVVFLSGITGSKMTGFRIGYMALFLIFIVVFQISWRAWKKIMWVYWFILIGYAMAILILIYTYQFDKFPTYWKEYLHVSETLQLDIGLAEIGPTVLFLHLVGPTLIVIMTVIQLQYFHKKYIKLLDHTVPNTENSRATDSKKEQDATEMDYDNVEDPTIRTNTEKDKKTMWEKVKSISMGQFKQYVVNGWEFGWLFLEMHLIKLCLVISFFICVRNPCFLHILFAVLTIIAAAMPTRFQIFASRLLSTFTAIIFLANMIYQVDYIEHSNYDANCTNSSTFPKDFNNAKWFGFEKETNGLASLLKGYIWYLIVVTIHAVVVFRQTLKRLEAGQSPKRPPVLFQNITFKNCERDMVYMLKYLLNYGFYRFGIEISLIAMVILIASRLDFIAFFYAIWVLVVYSMSREQKSRIWRCLITFNIIMLIYQYVMIVGLPPGLCYEYPWNTSLLQHIQELGMLPDYDLKLQITKLYFDFILLFFLARQQLVFDIENRIRTNETEYPGGSNQSIVEAVGNQSFSQIQNPTPDFTTYVRNWLDVIKCFVLLGFFWYTLAIVFLTGTNRVNIFSLGYLFGSFVFLWQGSDFYLRPISVIIQRWNMLVKYNLIVILIKTIMQLTGCLFYEPIANISCSLIQILGITCINRTGMKFKIDFHICDTPHDDEAGLFWDVICFSFLLLQLRIFKSYYFCHVVNDTKASNMLASRGAQLIEVYRAKQMKIQTEHENEILDKIKMKMDRIKEVQKKYSQVKEPRTHAGDDKPPMARTTSMSSCAGYHTPIEDEVVTSIVIEGDAVSELPSDNGTTTGGRGGTLLYTAISPSSAVMTISLDAYLDPQRLSISSPPGSDHLPRIPSLDESFPVFSPPPHQPTHDDSNPNDSGQSNTLVPSVLSPESAHSPQSAQRHRRQSSLNAVTFPDQQVDENGQRRRYSSTLNPADVVTDIQSPVVRRRPSSRRRISSMGASFRDRRRSSCISGYDDDMSRSQRYSWGPLIGELTERELIVLSARSPRSHSEYDVVESSGSEPLPLRKTKRVQSRYRHAIRSGDYHMFQDVNYDVDLNMFRERKDGDDVDESDRRMKKKMKLSEKKQRRREPSEFETDETIQQDGQQPSTSRGGDSGRDHSPDIKSLPKDDDDIQPEEEAKMKALRGFMFIIRFVESAIISLALKLDKVSRNYRYVRKILTKEKKQLKESEGFHMGLRISSALIWGQHPGNEEDTIVANDDKLANDETATISSGSVSLDVVDSPRKSFGSSYTRDVTEREQLEKGFQPPVHTLATTTALEPSKERRISMLPEIRILAPSLERGLDEASPYKFSQSFDDMDSPSHVPESEEFGQQEHSAIVELLRSIWFLFLSHTDLICYFMVLLNQVFSASLLSLPLPLMVFFWGTLTIPRPSKTFWITLIAYTQTVVLLKCASQFDLLWWNQNQIPDNQPLAPARIFGLEKKPGYATFDLALLLVIFFHRYMLKSMGLWKTEFKDELLPDGTYKTQNGTQTNEDVKSPVPLAIKNKDDEEQAAIITDGKTALILKPYDKEGTPEPEEGYVQVTTTEEEPSNFFPQGIQMAIKKYTSATKIFFASLLGPTSRPKRDVYAYMFMCDFINFLVLLFGFTSFGSSQTDGDDGVTSYLSENKVPILFLVMLLLQFVLIIIDRALYLRKYILGKLVFQYILIVFIHIWMFLILPGVTERRFNARRPPVIFYLVKCVYLLFAAFQIRCGYPSRILGNMLTKGYGMINLMLHHVFMGIPFLYELRTVMDWIWTDTTMTLFDWLKMEDIFVNIFRLKCGRQMESEYPAPAGTKKKTISKYMMGGLTLIILIVAIWFPLAIFALSNTVGEPNPPFDVTVSLRLGPYQPVYEMSAQDSSIISFKANDFFSMQKQYLKSRKAVTFLAGYEAEDVTAILLAANSRSVWGISQPDKARLLEDVRGNSTITCRFKYSVSRLTHNKDNPGIITDERVYELKVNDPYRSTLAEMLESEVTIDKPVWLPFMFPKFLKVKNQGSLDASDALLTDPDNDITDNVYRNLSLKLFHSVEAEDKTVWWEVKETCDSDARKTALGILPYNDCVNSMVMYLFNDRLFPATLSFLTAGGIIGMYTTFIIFISRFIRGFMSGSSKSIMFEDLPYVDRVLQLCLDIYLVREALEFVLEEDLFARLIFLYRSPELMIKWTRDPDGSTVVEAIEDRPQNVPRDDPRDDDTLAPSDGLRQRR